jgi:hypothetical protein
VPLTVLYAGPVPAVVSAVQQINLAIPSGIPASFFSAATRNYPIGRVTIGQQVVSVPIAVNNN